jgi:hypothetical protein
LGGLALIALVQAPHAIVSQADRERIFTVPVNLGFLEAKPMDEAQDACRIA